MPQTTKVFRSLADLAPRPAKLPFRVLVGERANPRLQFKVSAADSVSALEVGEALARAGERVEVIRLDA